MLNTLPPKVRRSLIKLGRDVAVARKKRHLTTEMLAERVGVARTTYFKVEKGDPTVSMGVYAMTLFALGFGEVLSEIIDARHDDQGHLLDVARLPERVRTRKTAKPL